MKRPKALLLLLVILLLTWPKSAHATIGQRTAVIGQIVSFDEKTVRIKSGQRAFTFEKSQLKFPSYKVGDTIRIEMTQDELRELIKKQRPSRAKQKTAKHSTQ